MCVLCSFCELKLKIFRFRSSDRQDYTTVAMVVAGYKCRCTGPLAAWGACVVENTCSDDSCYSCYILLLLFL